MRYLFAFKEAAESFWAHQAFRHAAALSFYTVLSMAPLLLLLLAIAGLWLDRETIGKQLVEDVSRVAGEEAADVAQIIVLHANKPPPNRFTMILGLAALIFGASAVFNQLQHSLNLIWGVEKVAGYGVMRFLRARLISLLMVLGMGLILLILPLLTAMVAIVNMHLADTIPQILRVWQYVSLLASTLILTVVFATIFKILPPVKVTWGDVWVGAASTAAMFTVGQFLIGLYLGYSSVGSAYGAAGSLVVLLVWIYYSALIVFLGAELTHTIARQRN